MMESEWAESMGAGPASEQDRRRYLHPAIVSNFAH